MWFLSIIGVGGETGWGYIGPQLSQAVETVASLLEVNLVKLSRLRATALIQRNAKEAQEALEAELQNQQQDDDANNSDSDNDDNDDESTVWETSKTSKKL